MNLARSYLADSCPRRPSSSAFFEFLRVLRLMLRFRRATKPSIPAREAEERRAAAVGKKSAAESRAAQRPPPKKKQRHRLCHAAALAPRAACAQSNRTRYHLDDDGGLHAARQKEARARSV